jgi:hypothetical protein
MKLTEAQKKEWRDQHIRSRVWAMFADIELLRGRERQLPKDTLQKERFLHECWIQASWEGRHAATRWLIEFVGVVGLRSGKAIIASEAQRKEHDFWITDLGGKFLDQDSDVANQLAKLRHDINKATGHPTGGSAHDQIAVQRIHRAAITIVEHIQEHVYSPVGEVLLVTKME